MSYGQPYESVRPPSAAYLLCKLTSAEARSAYLMLGSHDALKVWLNGKVVYEQRQRRRFDVYADSVKIDLPAGESVLCLKTVRSGLGWSVAARLAADLEEATALTLESHAMLAGRLLERCIVPSGEPVVFSPFGLPDGAKLDCSIRDVARTFDRRSDLVGRTATFPESATLAPGLYWAEIRAGGRLYSQPFIAGSSASVAAELITQADRLTLDEAGRLNVEALKRRIAFLLRPENLQQDRTLVHALTELAGVIKASGAHEEPFKGVPGLHVRAFKSAIDDQVQHYRIFVPASYQPGKKLPLVVILPTTISSAKPFVESAFMAAHSEAERMSVLAEKYGVAVLWSGYRKMVRSDPCEFAHVDEAIAAVAQDYAIDPERITLAGSCSAGVMAAELAARKPDKFAAIALHNAVFGVPKITTAGMVRACYANASFRQWALETDAVEEFMDRCSLPTLLVHDGAEPGHGDLAISEEFAALGQRRGRPVTLERVPQTVAQHFGAWDRMLAWLSQARRTSNAAPAVATPTTINEVFTQRFAVATAGGGTTEDQRAASKLGDRFAAEWRSSTFGDCRHLDETRAATADENLVLIGNASASPLWAALSTKAGLSVESDRIRIGDRVWLGKDLSVQVRLNHPQAPGKSIVFVGGSNLPKVQPATMNLAMDGWYQYAIWDSQGKLVDAGML